MRRIYNIGILLCSLLYTVYANAQTPSSWFVEKLTTEQGLSSNRINDMVQDDNGFLWIATSDGLNRFDGTEVTQYYNNENPNSLPHNYVYCLKKLPGNYLAIGTQAGLSFYNGNTGLFENFYYAQNNSLDEYNNTIIGLEQDTNGNLWVASRNCIYVFDPHHKLKKRFPSPFNQAELIRRRGSYVGKMMKLSNGQMLFCLFDGWYVSNAEANGFTRMENSGLKDQLHFITEVSPLPTGPKSEQYFSPSNVFKVFDKYFLCIKRDADSLLLIDEHGRQSGSCYFPYNKYPYVLWSQQVCMIDSSRIFFLFHNYGLCMIPVEWQQQKPVIHTPPSLLFDAHEYDAALSDRQGNWWLATTEEGLQKISPYKQGFKNNVLIDQQTGKQALYDVNFTTRFDNKLWLSTYGNGFFTIDLLTGKQAQHRFSTLYKDSWTDFIWNIRPVCNDTLWIGTQSGLFWYCISSERSGHVANYPGKPLAIDSVPITMQFMDRYGMTWMGLGKGKGLCRFDPLHKRFTYFPGSSSQGYPFRYPVGAAEDSKGDLWFSNDASTSLVHWHRNNKLFETVALPGEMKKKASNLYGIWCEGDSIIWLGTITSGLIKFNPVQNTAMIYGHERGLINSHISNIYQDKTRKLWLSTDGGLSCFDPRTETFFNYSEKDGLPAQYLTSFYYDTLDKNLYSGSHGISIHFDPMEMMRNKGFQQTIITAMHVNGKLYMPQPRQTIMFDAQQNDIAIHYAAVDMINGAETQYSYKLIGEDTNWVVAGHQRQINFSKLRSGHYTFMVRSGNNNGSWSEQVASVNFYIHPPFTQSTLFFVLLLLALTALVYALYWFRLRQLAKTEQIRTEISRNLHDEVGSTLTNISLDSLLAQKHLQHTDTVNHLLERIYQDSQTVSQTMREIVWSINPKIDTLEEALPRMLQYASELLEAKDVELKAEIAPGIEKIKLNMQERRDLYLIFKEAVNNLARHSCAKHAGVRFCLSDHAVIMTINDDGAGFDKSAFSTSNGLRNMRERAEHHRWKLCIQSAPGQGTSLELKAPIA